MYGAAAEWVGGQGIFLAKRCGRGGVSHKRSYIGSALRPFLDRWGERQKKP